MTTGHQCSEHRDSGSPRVALGGGRKVVSPLRRSSLFGVVLALLLAHGCRSGGGLNQSKAEKAIESWVVGNHGPPHCVRVVGVREEPQTNSAEADLAFDHFPMFLSVGAGRSPQEYTGQGTAHFVRYTDGRWVLKKIMYGKELWGGPYIADEINIEARDGATKTPTGTPSDVPNAPEALAKIERARWMLTSQRPLDMVAFVVLLDDAVKLTPAVKKPAAAVWRRWAILFSDQGVQPEQIALALNKAVELDPSLADDNTIRTMYSRSGSAVRTGHRRVKVLNLDKAP